MLLAYENGVASVVLRIWITDPATGLGKTGLTTGSSGLNVSTLANNEASATAYAGGNLETIATLGTFAAPTSGKCRFKEVDATNHPGLYELQIADARWAVSSARYLDVQVLVTGYICPPARVQLKDLPANVRQYGGSSGTFSGGRPEVNASHWGGAAVASANVLIDGAITGAKIAADAITSAKVADGFLTAAKFASGAFDAVWSVTARTLSAAGVQAIWDALTSAFTTSGSIGKWILDKLNVVLSTRAATGDAMTLTSGERTAIANEVEAQIIDDTDSEKVLQAITDKIASVNPSLAGLTLAAIATAVRTELTIELARIDQAISSRLATSGYTAPANSTIASIAAAIVNLALEASLQSAITAIATVDGVADAIKLKTDKLTFDADNALKSNIKKVNDVAITGTGVATSDEWRPE